MICTKQLERQINLIIKEHVFGFPLGVDYEIFKFSSFTKKILLLLCYVHKVWISILRLKGKRTLYMALLKIHYLITHYSALMARDKPDGGVRIIVDLSWPIGQSVNSCVAADIYDNIPFTLKYPTVDQVVQGKNSGIWS